MARVLVAALAALLSLTIAAPAGAQACGPKTPPTFDPSIPTWSQVNGFELGSRKATVAELDRYLVEVDLASDLVRTGHTGRSWKGRELNYIAVSTRENLARLDTDIAPAMRAARNGGAAPSAELPALLWVTSNVHGNEPSGADGSMRLLYELVARTDCWNATRLQEAVTFVLPTQNPDGREANTRVNDYGFDMNRDWFARTQPETDGKVAMLRKYPPILYIDAHEQGGTAGFFPPNADPIHHEISTEALSHINDTYGPAMRTAAAEANFDYTNYTVYDMFFMGYGDTVPTTAFGSAGMTFEKGSSSPYTEKTFEQYTNQRASVDAAVLEKDRLVSEWARQFAAARDQGASGTLEPNLVVQPGNTVTFPVPAGEVHGYFLRADRHAGDAVKLVRRLQALDVEVHTLTDDATVPGYHRIGHPGTADQVVPAGTYWIPMAQPQKHWVQALLGEDAYVPFAYFYDVSAWSNPQLMGLEAGVATQPVQLPVAPAATPTVPAAAGAYAFDGGSSVALALALRLARADMGVRRVTSGPDRGDFVVPGTSRTDLVDALREHPVPLTALAEMPAASTTSAVRVPKVGLLDSTAQSAGFARYALERQLGLTVTKLGASAIETGALTGLDALVVPDGTGVGGLTPLGLVQLHLWVRTGGTLVGYRNQGLTVARAAGFTTALPAVNATANIPGASFGLTLDPANPVAWGLDADDFVFNTGDPLIQPGTSSGAVVGAYPSGEKFFQSGYAEGTDSLQGTPALLDETVGAGHAVLFTFDPNFRAYAESGLRLFGNALLYPKATSALARKRSYRKARRSPRARAAAARRVNPAILAGARLSAGRDSVIRVPLTAAPVLQAAKRLAGLPAGASVRLDLRSATLRIPNVKGIDVHEAVWVPRLFELLDRARVRPSLVIL